VRDVVQRSLRRTPRPGICLARVEPVLEDVNEECAEVLGAECLQLLRDEVELVTGIVVGDLLLHARRHGERIAIHLHHLADRHGALRGIEIGCIGEEEAQRIAHAPIALHHPLQDLVGNEQLPRVVGRGHPKTQDLCAE
jgi:hypothetical protein